MPASTRRRVGAALAIVYAGALVASHLWGGSGQAPRLRPADRVAHLLVVSGTRTLERRVDVVYRDTDPDGRRHLPTVVLVHGSPGGLHDFDELTAAIGDRLRVIRLDLPGFGRSAKDVPDLSFAAHARYVLELLDAVGVQSAHWVGFSMGGGVVLSAAALAPDRVASVSMVGSIGVQELELLGRYDLNHAIHGVQLGLIWGLENLVPLFGALERFPLNLEYARNFYESDQRPLRGILEHLSAPTLIVHGRDDPLVPYAAALEHHRLVPQSELVTLEGGHFMLWEQPAVVAQALVDFVTQVERGEAPTRAEASLARRAEAAAPYVAQERARGIGLFVLLVLIVLGTFVTEDLTCIATGLLIAAGRLSFGTGLAACFAGILLGDQLLYLAGRLLGPAVLERGPVHWFVRPSRIADAARWFERRGMVVILLSRFVPGTRLPTYVAAGMVRVGFWRFLAYFAVAVMLWTPLLVGLSVVAGRSAADHLEELRRWSLAGLLGLTLLLLVIVRVGVPALSHRGRRRLAASWRRATQWEFWPLWVFYTPLLVWIALLAVRHRMLRGLTAVNPGMPLGGLVGESKAAILQSLAPATVARFHRLPADHPDRGGAVRAFLAEHDLALPVVLKPDVGERGRGVTIVRSFEEVEARVRVHDDLLVQEYVPGVEFGVFYVRRPDEAHGRIFSITEKVLPEVVGDGESTLEWLVLDDPRAVIQSDVILRAHPRSLDWVPAAGERVPLVELGTHCRGALFLDGGPRNSPALEAAIDAASADVDGFFFGRYDVRSPSPEDFTAGRFRILELNGLTSEATHVYAPGTPLARAYRVLARQWALAFAIAVENRRRGARGATWSEILEAWRRARHHP